MSQKLNSKTCDISHTKCSVDVFRLASEHHLDAKNNPILKKKTIFRSKEKRELG